jgi:hypothetical protein
MSATKMRKNLVLKMNATNSVKCLISSLNIRYEIKMAAAMMFTNKMFLSVVCYRNRDVTKR